MAQSRSDLAPFPAIGTVGCLLERQVDHKDLRRDMRPVIIRYEVRTARPSLTRTGEFHLNGVGKRCGA
jgi:hypothetical protein